MMKTTRRSVQIKSHKSTGVITPLDAISQVKVDSVPKKQTMGNYVSV